MRYKRAPRQVAQLGYRRANVALMRFVVGVFATVVNGSTTVILLLCNSCAMCNSSATETMETEDPPKDVFSETDFLYCTVNWHQPGPQFRLRRLFCNSHI